MTEIRVASGPDDPRLYEVDEEFRRILGGLSSLAAASRIQKARFFHRTGTTARGTLRVLEAPRLPAHDFFTPGRKFHVLARYSNGMESDDIAPAIRGLTLRLLDPDRPDDFTSGLLDLTLSTGECFHTGSAALFALSGTEEGRSELMRLAPHTRSAIWGCYRRAVSYAKYHYYSQTPRAFMDRDGKQWFARFRVVPPGSLIDPGVYDPGDLMFPPDPPNELERRPDDYRSRTFLHEDVRTRVTAEGVYGTLQIQLRPVSDSDVENNAALDCSHPWSGEWYPWRNLAALRLDSLADNEAAEALRSNPGLAPASLGIVLATSPRESASLNHLRVLLYQLTSAARRGEQPPAPLAALLGMKEPEPAAAISVTERPKAPRTVCVLGGGPSGLTVARGLERAGHRAVVLEARDEIGGKCDSVEIDGRAYDLGGHICTTAYENLANLVTELGVGTEDTTPHRVYDIESAEFRPQSNEFFRPDTFRRYAALRAGEFPRIADAGLAHSARALAAPVREWLGEHGFEALAQDLGVGYTGAGYGYLDAELPALYFVKYAEMTGLLSNRPELLGHAGSFTIKGGFSNLWQHVATELGDVRRGVTVESIRRDEEGVRIRTSDGVVRADELVVSVPLHQALPLLDASPQERDLASRVRHIDYYTTVATISGLPRSAFYLLRQPSESPAMRGHCVSYHHRYPETDVFTCYSYGAAGMDEGDIEALLREDVARMGGRVEKVHLQRRWAFMPHFGTEDLRAGVYERFEALQGEQHTYYAGGLPAYETVESNIAYANQLIGRFFDSGQGHRSQSGGDSTADGARRVGGTSAAEPAQSGAQVTVDEVRRWLITHVAAELREPESAIDANVPLQNYALESLSVAALQARLSEWLGYRVPHTLFLELPTIEAMAAHLATGEKSAPTSTVPSATASRQPTHVLTLTPAQPFFCIGGSVGAVYYLRSLARAVGDAHPFYGLQAPGLDGTEEPLDQVEELARFYLDQIRRVQPHGPFLLGGHSFGGLVAYEIGRQLLELGERVARVVMLDTYITVAGQVAPPADEVAAIEELLLMNRLTTRSDAAGDIVIDPAAPISQQRQLLAKALGATGALPMEEHIVNMLRVYQSNLDAIVEYEPEPAELRVTLLKAEKGFPPVLKGDRQIYLHIDHAHNGWEYVGLDNLDTVEVPGDHFSMFAEPNLQAVAAELRRCLRTEGS